jgi:hypothetical protein
VIELAALLSIVENPELAHGVDETGVKREASVEVLVVVVRHGEQWRPALPHDARGGENVSGREGDVLGFRHRGGPFSAAQQRPLRAIRTRPDGSLTARPRTSPNGAANSVSLAGMRPRTAR